MFDANPAYVGISLVETYLFDCQNRHAATARAVGGGALLALAPGKGIMAHREPNDVLHTYVAVTKPLEWITAMDFASPEARSRLAAELADWSPVLTALITDGETPPRDARRCGRHEQRWRRR